MEGRGVTLYIKISMSNLVYDHIVTIGDIASVECTDAAIRNRVKTLKLYSFSNPGNVSFSILKVVEIIHQEYPALAIVNEGEADFILEYRSKKPGNAVQYLKVALVCILLFFGSAFTIMAFHNDIDITKLFDQCYLLVTGTMRPNVSVLEISYTVGLGIGILVFFNHVGRKKLTHDLTPIQVEMRKYEKDADTAFIENASRKDEDVDVS